MPILAADRIDHRTAAAVAVVPVALQRGCHAQPVAEVELVALPVLDRQVALHVVAQADDGRTAGVAHDGEAVGAVVVIAALTFARLGPGAQVVQPVVRHRPPLRQASVETGF